MEGVVSVEFRLFCTDRGEHESAVLGNVRYDADLHWVESTEPREPVIAVGGLHRGRRRRADRTLLVEDTPDGRQKVRVNCNFCDSGLLLRAEKAPLYFRNLAAVGVVDVDISRWSAMMVLQFKGR
jgi:hypothetical protein